MEMVTIGVLPNKRAFSPTNTYVILLKNKNNKYVIDRMDINYKLNNFKKSKKVLYFFLHRIWIYTYDDQVTTSCHIPVTVW